LNIKLEQLRVFVAVAESGSITAAAAQIGRSAAAVSMALSQVDHQVGAPLFDGERKSKLTPLGRHTLQQARRAVDEHENAMRAIARFASGEEGMSRVAVVPSVATRLLPAAVGEITRGNSGIQIRIRDLDSSAIHDALIAGTVDFGIAGLPSSGALHAEFLLADPFRLVCRRDHPLAALERPVDWRDLAGEALIVNGLCHTIDDTGWQKLIDSATLYIHNTWSILSFVEEGIGVTLLPALAQPISANLVALPLTRAELERELYVLRREGSSLNPLDQRLIDAVRRQAEHLEFATARPASDPT
jgi:LysR family transcriptional regulator, carnitine catabolism transcriptional activator